MDPEGSIVLLRDGPASPLFVIPGFGEGLDIASRFAALVEPRYAVYGLLPWDKNAQGSHPTVEELAAVLVRLLTGLFPRGPYLLVGYSWGGLVALELARELRNMGHEVGLLVLVDTYPHRSQWPAAVLARVVLRRAAFHVRALLSNPSGNRLDYLLARFRGTRRYIQDWSRSDREKQKKLVNIGVRQVVEIHQYRPRYCGGLLYFITSSISTDFPNDPVRCWGALFDDIKIIRLAGDHLQIWADSYPSVAAKINDILLES